MFHCIMLTEFFDADAGRVRVFPQKHPWRSYLCKHRRTVEWCSTTSWISCIYQQVFRQSNRGFDLLLWPVYRQFSPRVSLVFQMSSRPPQSPSTLISYLYFVLWKLQAENPCVFMLLSHTLQIRGTRCCWVFSHCLTSQSIWILKLPPVTTNDTRWHV